MIATTKEEDEGVDVCQRVMIIIRREYAIEERKVVVEDKLD